MDIYQSRREEDWLLLLLRKINLPIFWKTGDLLNCDYKIAAKSIANRIKKVLPKIINNDQTGFLKNRTIGENIRLIDSIIKYASTKQIPGLLLFIDFEKAFDSIEWPFIERTLKHFNFGASLVTWFKLFYTNISRLYPKQWLVFWVLLFESLSETGMPALPVSLFLCAEVLANAVRKDENIRGINIANVECKLSQQADDTTIILNGSELSLSRTLLFLDNFAISSRLKISCEKTEKLRIGSCKDSPYQTICILKLILKYLKCIFSIWTLFSCILILFDKKN